MMEHARKISVPAVVLPKGGGAIKGIGETFQPNAFSGTADLSIPIFTSPARGPTPQLTLDYSSGSGDDIFGLGFRISIPHISRKTEKGIPKYDGTDTFVISNAEDLVPKRVWQNGRWVLDEHPVACGEVAYTILEYRPRIEGLFARIERWTRRADGDVHWRVVSKEHVTSIYGQSDTARIVDPADTTRIFSWLLEATADPKGNNVVYAYKQENHDRVPPSIYEATRSYTANRYIHSIKYGNYLDKSQQEQWAFEVIFDYGEYDIADLSQPNCHPYQAARSWPARPDPFSSYRSGFEIRTYRLCRNILMFHHMRELDADPCLVRSTQLIYDSTPSITFIKAVKQVGFRKNADGSYAQQALPPLDLTYSSFDPATQTFQTLTVADDRMIPGYLDAAGYRLVDLYGEGIPGLLYTDDTTTLYWEALGGGRFAPPVELPQFPITRDLRNGAEYTFASLTGNGRYDVVVNDPAGAGYYQCNADRSWTAFKSFDTFPLAYATPKMELADIDGDGLADLVLFADLYTTVYPSQGTRGFAAPVQHLRDHQVALANGNSAEEVVTFADMFGDGLSHRVRIRSGLVECWPNLGYGRFGEPVLFGNAPQFDGTLDVSRLFLVDVDGSGTTDLIYVYDDRVELYANQSGNSFSQPLAIPLPNHYNDLAQVTFADIQGNGTLCLVVGMVQPDLSLSHLVYDFAGNQKPYLLQEFCNNLGATTTITYKSSVSYYLDDKQAGHPWATQVPFPVNLVARIESIDQIAGSRLISQYVYRDGYYDPVEREFRGFGYVERWDCEPFVQYAQSSARQTPQLAPIEEQLFVQPAYTRTWYHTGAYRTAGIVSKHNEHEYYDQDQQALRLADSVFDPAIDQSDAETIRQAYRAMKGLVIREEVFGGAGLRTGDTDMAHHPYTVSESNVKVCLVQPRDTQAYAVFYVHDRESITYHYERNPDDPRIQHAFTLSVDEFGNLRESCTVFYPRRTRPGVALPAEQLALKATAAVNSFITPTPNVYLTGAPCEERHFEIGGLKPGGGFYFTFDEINTQVQAALEHVLPFEGSLTPGQQQARLLEWTRYYYTAQTEALPLGSITAQALLHHVEQAIFSSTQITAVFANNVTDAMLRSTALDGGGYTFDAGYWWNPGLADSYYGPEHYYLPRATHDPFGATTSVTYDDYCLLPTAVVDPLGHTTTVEVIDYQTLQPQKIRDINHNDSELLFDPLGLVIATSVHGMTDGKREGDGDLDQYQLRSAATLADIYLHPQHYLQMASSYFFYDLSAWMTDRVPAYAVSLVREQYLSASDGTDDPIHINVTHSDGYGRVLQTKIHVDDRITLDPLRVAPPAAPAQGRWLTTGKTVYNNKGMPARQYEPFWSPTGAYDDATDGVYASYQYDALLREIRIDTPKGFFSKVELTPWWEQHYDLDDTVKDSPFYRQHVQHRDSLPDECDLPPDECAALQMAAGFYNTPATRVFDTVGHPFLTIEDNLGMVRTSAFDVIVNGTTITSESLWNELQRQGYLDAQGFVTDRFQPYQPGFKLDLDSAYMRFAAQVIDLLRQSCLTTYHQVDVASLEWTTIDPRLYYANITRGTQLYNFKNVYAMSGERLLVDSADAGRRLSLSNMRGQPIDSWDDRGFHVHITYNLLQLPSAIVVDQDGQDRFTSEEFIYGTDPNHNSVEKLIEHKDQAGIVYYDLYNIQAQLLQRRRQLCQEYKTPVSWQAPQQPLLEEEVFTLTYTYNALNWITSETTPDGSVTTLRYHTPGWLQQVTVAVPDQDHPRPMVKQIFYNARGERQRVEYDNSVVTSYTYEPTTFRLMQMFTVRSSDQQVLQQMAYTYDPVGNITHIEDASYETVFCRNQQVTPRCDYTYDALYRLVNAAGRQHPCIQQDTHSCGFKQSRYMPVCPQAPHANNLAQLEQYTEQYSYDDSGNLVRTRHVANSACWSRVVDIPESSNRGVPKDSPHTRYDANGNVTCLDNLSAMHWDYRNNLARVDVIVRQPRPGNDDCCQSGPCCQDTDQSDRDYFVYDSAGNRVRKVIERYAGGGQVLQIEEKIYLGTYEIKRIKQQSVKGSATIMDRRSLRVMDDGRCVAISHSWLADERQRETDTPGKRTFRYQLDNQLGSSCVEVDGDGKLISYEEYFPYGGTALIAGNSQREVSLKEYRYSGKERDDSTGLYYYGARYYAPWLGRWMSPDPAGTVDGLNLYAFVCSNPITYKDNDGRVIIHHWNVKDKTSAGLNEAKFIKETATVINKDVKAQEGAVAFLTEIMGSVTSLAFNNFIQDLNKQSSHQWTGKLIPVGVSELGSRKEQIAILHTGVEVTNYWQLVQPNLYFDKSVKDTTLAQKHQKNSRYPIGVDMKTKITGEEQILSIAGYHNQGPSSGAGTRAGFWRDQLRNHGVHVAIGDWNVEPAEPNPKRMRTRSSDSTAQTKYDTVSTSKGGSYYDYAQVFNDTIGGRQLYLTNLTGSKGESSDHQSSSAKVATRKRQREE